MENIPELPTNPIEPPAFCRITYGNLEADKWFFLRVNDEERCCQITHIYNDESVRVHVTFVRNVEFGNLSDWIADEDTLVLSREDIEDDEDEPVLFFVRVLG